MLLNFNLETAVSRLNKKFNSFNLFAKSAHLTAALFLTAVVCLSGSSAQAGTSYNVLDASERGTTKTGNAKASIVVTYDEAAKKDVLEFDYTLAAGESAAVWAGSFPVELNEASVNSVKMLVKVLSAEQLGAISVNAVLKGSKGTQDIPLKLKAGLNTVQAALDWAVLGNLESVEWKVTASGDTKGTLSLGFDLIFAAPKKIPAAVPAAEKIADAADVVKTETAAAVKQTDESAIAALRDMAEKQSDPEADSVKPAAPVQKEARTTFNLLEGKERGVQKDAGSKGSVMPTFDEAAGIDILEFDYTLPASSSVTAWTKNFPAELNASSVNTVKLGIRVPEPGQNAGIQLKVALKGEKGVQEFPVELNSGWNSLYQAVDWEKVGVLDQVSFIVTPAASAEVKGMLNLSLEFIKLQFPEKLASTKNYFSQFNLLDAGEKGVFNIGASKGTIISQFDEEVTKEVWGFDYSLPAASVVGIWTKTYPQDLNRSAADAVKIGVRVPSAQQLGEVAVKVEIKGKSGMQTVPLRLMPGLNSFTEPINWNTTGELTEVVFVVSPMARKSLNPSEEPKPMTGMLYFDLDFGKLSFWQKNYTFVKTFAAAGFALVLAALVFLLTARGKKDGEKKKSILTVIPEDLFKGVIGVLIAGAALKLFFLGTFNPLDTGIDYAFLAVALIGALIPAFLKLRVSGRFLTGGEALQNLLVSGLLAAASSRQEIWQAPSGWGQLFIFSNLIAVIAFLIYQISNTASISNSGKHVKAIQAAWIAGTPYLFNWLLLLENSNFLRSFSNGLTFGLLSAMPLVLETAGRLIVMIVFNEILINGISQATKGKYVAGAKAHWMIFFVSLGTVVAPLIADLGSVKGMADFPVLMQAIFAVVTTMLSFAGLWAEVYLITGILLDGGHSKAPNTDSITNHINVGMRKGMAYSGILVAILYVLYMVVSAKSAQAVMLSAPLAVGVIVGGLLFPFLKTIIETFDGSLPFFERTRYSYRDKTLYLRGAIAGYGFAYIFASGLYQQPTPARCGFGFLIGLLASGGISLLRDIYYSFRGQGRVQSWRLYFVDSLLGVFASSAIAFYLDSMQVPVVIAKFNQYVSSGFEALSYVTYPLLNKWGRIDLGSYTGGVKLLYTESLAGVINWSIAAWLFAINKVFMQAFFDKDKTPIKFFFSKEGFAQLIEHMIYVLRWGLWMSPIIFTFLRMMPEPTWYNQDGAIRTLFATWNSFTMNPQAFEAWSLQIFVYILAFDFFRILIWMDHMGLRVATLVNLSFLGMDKLDEKLSKFIGPAAAQRYIPEGIKRFTTWAPLLIPFYLPRGEQWDYVWSTAEAMQNASRGKGIMPALQNMNSAQAILLALAAVAVFSALSFVLRKLGERNASRKEKVYELTNREYKLVLKEYGDCYSEVNAKETLDVTRRSYDLIDPSGKIVFLVDADQQPGTSGRVWPVFGNFPRDQFEPSSVEKVNETLRVTNHVNGIKTTIDMTLPDLDTAAETWEITIENTGAKSRKLCFVPYMEWVLQGWIHDRFHTQYSRLFPEMEYVSETNAVLAWQKSSKAMGFLATDAAPQGFMTSRMDFIGRAQSIWEPRVLDTMNFLEPFDTPGYPTFDPIGSLLLKFELAPKGQRKFRMILGHTKDRKSALEVVKKFLKPQPAKAAANAKPKKKSPLIGHGEILPGTPQMYSEFVDNGNKLRVLTPFTPRPYDHAVSNEIHSVMVTNRGLHTSCNGNSQQNRLTPDWPDLVTKEIPTEAIYLYEADKNEWYSPTYHPLNKKSAKYESEFSVDGTAVFRMTDGQISTELTVFVPQEDPTGIYLLTVKNSSDQKKKIRVAPYYQIVLSFQPERSGVLSLHHDRSLDALYYENPRNIFRSGWAFASMSIPADCVETRRGRFFGKDRGVKKPYLVETGKPDATQFSDDRQIAAFLGTLEIPARGEATVAMVLGQADDRKKASQIVQKYKSLKTVRETLANTRKWWNDLMETAKFETNHAEFDRLQNWLKYQAVAERIWARRGFYQTSGAYGFRDQLQDTVNLMWVDPALARKQIILHASQQFIEGDVFHWFFTLVDGRTAFSCRSQASDNPVWISWALADYVKATGDESILDEMVSYVVSEFPYGKLPKNKHGWGHLYHRGTRSDTVYRHCMRSLDLILDDRSGRNGLPLIQTGDWNDGLDEIGSEGKGESVWLGLFVYYILKNLMPIIQKKDGNARKEHYQKKMNDLGAAIERTWRTDRYLRAIHDDGTEIGIKDSGIWEIDALTAAWAVMAGINFDRAVTVFNTALKVLEKDNAILLGWPALREDTKPYLGRSSKYPEGVRENGMYCHGVQWMVRAARLLAEQFDEQGNTAKAAEYRETAYRLWQKISPIAHVTPKEIEIYGGQPNKQSADILTNFDQGRMIWHGYTGAAGWMLRQAFEGVVGATLSKNRMTLPSDLDKPRGSLKVNRVIRDVRKSPLKGHPALKELANAAAAASPKATILPPEEVGV